LTVLVEGFEAFSAIEAIGFAAFNARNFTIVAEPFVGTRTILVIAVVGRPKVLVPGVRKILDTQSAASDTTSVCARSAGKGAVRHGPPHVLTVGPPMANGTVAGPDLRVESLLAGPLDGAVLLRVVRAPDGGLHLAVFSKVGGPIVLGVGAIAKALGCWNRAAAENL
jgi:hypothetical protein